jgi:hypothetical protein
VPNDQEVWRYVEFAKFIAMLREGGLYFSRADRFDDRFEGATGLANRRASWDEFYLDYFRKIVVTAPPGYPNPELSSEQIEREADRLLKAVKNVAQEARKMLANCWHMGDSEAEALWRLYAPPGTSGVAIKSTVGRLWDASAEDGRAIVGRVHYIDYQRSFASIQNERIFQKRKSLSHEQEVRIVVPNERQLMIEGRTIVCDLNKLVSQVVVSPFTPPWFLDVVGDVANKYGFSFDIRRSALLDEPFF